MDRRQVIRNFLVVGAGLAFMPSCVYKDGKVSIQLQSIQINPDQESFLKQLADAIIPPTDTPGAAELGSHLFALKMVDDCFEKQEQDKFMIADYPGIVIKGNLRDCVMSVTCRCQLVTF